MNYRDSLLLTDEHWTSLSDEKKIEVLQTIENHMAFECGRINCPVEGRFLYTGTDGIVLGSYDPISKTIFINTSQFDEYSKYGGSSETLVTTCIHEGRHAYQHQVADGLINHDNAEEAQLWKENLSDGHYISFRENPKAYYEQPVEVDARSFAHDRYQQLIEEREELTEEYSSSQCDAHDVFESQMTHLVQRDQKEAASYSQAEEKCNNEGVHMQW